MINALIKDVTKAKLVAPILSVNTLIPRATSCLAFCKKYISHRPKSRDLTGVFRSEKLKEAAQGVFPFSCHTIFSESVANEFKEFSERRANLISPSILAIDAVEKELHRSHSLLMTDWSASLFDGVMTPETDGFIDDDGMPPWDTWLALVQAKGSLGIACLLSWVPKWLYDKINSAIAVDASNSISWVEVRESGKLELATLRDSSIGLSSETTSIDRSEAQRKKTLPIGESPTFLALEKHANAELVVKGYRLLRRKGFSSWIVPDITPLDASVRFKLCNYKNGIFFGVREEWAAHLGIPLEHIGGRSFALGSSGILFRGDYVKDTPSGRDRIKSIVSMFP